MSHKDFNLSFEHGFNEVAKTMQTLLASHWQFGYFPDERHPFFKNYIKYDFVACKINSNFQMEFGVLMK